MIDFRLDTNWDMKPHPSTGDYEFVSDIDAFNQAVLLYLFDEFYGEIGTKNKAAVPVVISLRIQELANLFGEIADEILLIDVDWADEAQTEIGVEIQYRLADDFSFNI